MFEDNREIIHPKLVVKLVTVTPALAKKMLNDNPNNRKVKPVSVEVIRRDMVAGKYDTTGSGISISPYGELLDGQHRLTALVVANVSIRMVVTYGVPREAIHNIDRGGSPRSAPDVLRMLGYTNSVEVASTIGVMHKFSKGGVFGTLDQMQARLSQHELEVYLELFPEIVDAARFAAGCRTGIMPCSIYGGMLMIFGLAEQKEGDAYVFLESLESGENLTKGHPIWAVRDRLLKLKMNRDAKPTLKGRVYYVITAWNAFQEGRTLKHLVRRANSQVPLVTGLDPSVLPFYYEGRPEGDENRTHKTESKP